MGPKQKKWVEALRSGNYEQGRTMLCRDDRYCCLGVANEIFNLGLSGYRAGLCDLYEDSAEYKTLGLLNQFGQIGPSIEYKGQHYSSLTALNDQGVSFAEIADIIEKYPERIFTHSV